MVRSLSAAVLCLFLYADLALGTGPKSAENLEPSGRHFFRQYSPNGKYYIDLFPNFKTGPQGLAYQTRKAKAAWSVPWYGAGIALADDGEHLVRLGTSSSSTKTDNHLAIAFYHKEKEVKRYDLAELLKGELVQSKIGKDQKPVFYWLAQQGGFGKTTDNFHMTMVDGGVYSFDVATGKILSYTLDKEILKDKDRGVEAMGTGYVQARAAAATAKAFQAFAWDLYPRLAEENPNENLVLSPLDLAANLAFLSGGARGKTAQEIRDLLHLTDKNLDVFKKLEELFAVLEVQDVKGLLPGIQVSPFEKQGVQITKVDAGSPYHGFLKVGQVIAKLDGKKIHSQQELDEILNASVKPVKATIMQSPKDKVASEIVLPFPSPLLQALVSLWVSDKCQVAKEFENQLGVFRKGSLQKIGSNKEKTAQLINQEVALATRGRIKHFLSSDDLDRAEAILVSASLFAGDWLTPFVGNEKKQPFHLKPGKSIDNTMMTVRARLRYLREPEMDVVEIPYKGNRYSMVLLLPEPLTPLAALEKSLKGNGVVELLENLDVDSGETVDVILPPFTIAGKKHSLKTVLAKLGMISAFSPSADFSGVCTNMELRLDNVFHQGFIQVDERGTVAAAASASILIPRNSVEPLITFRMDRPFLFLIRERATNAILYMGRVSDPSKAN